MLTSPTRKVACSEVASSKYVKAEVAIEPWQHSYSEPKKSLLSADGLQSTYQMPVATLPTSGDNQMFPGG